MPHVEGGRTCPSCPRTGSAWLVLVNGDGPASAAADLLATSIYERLLGRPGVEARFTVRMGSLVRRAEESRRGLAEHVAEGAGGVRRKRMRVRCSGG